MNDGQEHMPHVQAALLYYNILFEEKIIIADENSCPVCWKVNIMAFTNECIFSYLDGLLTHR
jgi:hypothetical protein